MEERVAKETRGLTRGLKEGGRTAVLSANVTLYFQQKKKTKTKRSAFCLPLMREAAVQWGVPGRC